jgi:hypothetical protein
MIEFKDGIVSYGNGKTVEASLVSDKLIYEWVKTGKMSQSTFSKIVEAKVEKHSSQENWVQDTI